MQHSIIEYYSENEAYRCGYCKGRDTNYGHGLWAHTMTVTDYQDLIDRGWRRSGKYIYKPTLDLMCCPSYTIRCRALEFKISKSQKKVLKQFNKYLMGQDGMQLSGQGDQHMSSSCEDIRVEDYTEGAEQFVETTRAHQDIDLANIASQNSGEKLDDHKDTSLPFNTTDKQESVPGSTIHESKKAPGADPTKPPCKKAKQLRREKKLEKLKQKGIELTSLPTIIRNKEKQVEDFINELPQDCKHKLEIKLVRTTPPSPEWLATAKETHGVYVKYQTVIHGDKPEKCSEPKFKEFLVTSPLLMEHSDGGPSCGYGSFHQQYWLDGKIIAVGVIDILPKCVSSVYFFYDPQYMNLTLGTYGALREIEFTRHLHLSCPDLKYYYMGFYIHSCRKMRYKGNYSPSDLLCPETYKWFPIKDSITKLDNTPYSRLDPDVDSVDDNYPKESDIDYIPVLYKGQVMMYRLYSKNRGKASETASMMMEYARLVGAKTAKSLVMVT